MVDPHPYWEREEGVDLVDVEALNAAVPEQLTACLNIWNDLAELQSSIGSWLPFVSRVIAVDGAYHGRGSGPSDDGTREFLEGACDAVSKPLTWIPPPKAGFWPDQCAKRTRYMGKLMLDELAFVTDADESWEGLGAITGPYFDVGWVRYTSPIYDRAQNIPRIFRNLGEMEYQTRHHWVWRRGHLVSTQQMGGLQLTHRWLPIRMHNTRGANRSRGRRKADKLFRRIQAGSEVEADSSLPVRGHEPLWILQLAPIDPGNVIYRLHSAINTTTPHTSAMAVAKIEYTDAPRQYKLGPNRKTLRELARSADIVHMHVGYGPLKSLQMKPKRLVVHHHGTHFRQRHKEATAEDRSRGARLRFVSNLELTQYGSDLHWLPNPVPVMRYRRLAARTMRTPDELVIAHSPTKRGYKGTEVLLRVVERLQKKRLRVRVLLIEKKPLVEALRMKATAHVCFDSFWLGLQCSGLEAAAMGMPVLAGDPNVKALYEEKLGFCPYTYVAGERPLERAIEQLALDDEFREQQANRVHAYTLAYHDYPAVARFYLEKLEEAFCWREALAL